MIQRPVEVRSMILMPPGTLVYRPWLVTDQATLVLIVFVLVVLVLVLVVVHVLVLIIVATCGG
jgi:hypothetical protein